MSKAVSVAIAAEEADGELVERYGTPGNIYSCDINYWLWRVAIDLLKNRPDLGIIYVHTTDYPMHRWAPQQRESREHLSGLDQLLGEAVQSAQDAAFFITADHGMNAKKRCWDLGKTCDQRGIPLRFVLSPERDYYVTHHRNFTGCAWVWLYGMNNAARTADIIGAIEGVEEVLTRQQAAQRFHLMPRRIGDLVVLGDRHTMFGELDSNFEELETTYRAHGSLHEMNLPLVIYNYRGTIPHADCFSSNKDLLPFVFS